MIIELFSVSYNHKKLFDNLSKELDIKFEYYRYRRKKIKLSMDIFYFFRKVDFTESVEYSIKFFEARKNIKIPKFILKTYFFLELFEKYIRYILTLDSTRDYYIFWNGKKPRHLIAIQIVKLWNIKVLYMENGLLPHRLVLDLKGVNFENSVPRNREFFLNYKNNFELPFELTPRIPENMNKFKKNREELPKKFIFIPFQVDYDSQILLYSSWIENMRKLFMVIKILSKNSDSVFVLKEHPSSKKNYNDLHIESKKIKNIVFMNGYSTQELIEKSNAILTINSTVGIESLLFKKKVVVLGQAFYSINGITKTAKDINELIEIVNNLDKWKIDEVLIENFLKYLYYDYLIPLEKVSSIKFRELLLSKN